MKIIEIKKIEKETYGSLVSETFNLLVNLLRVECELKTPTCEKLCEALRPIFKVSEDFY